MAISYLEQNDSRYFTFFSEFNREWEPGAVILETIVLTVVFSIALVGNILVLAVIIIDETMRTVTNYLVSNLAVADLLFTLSMPFVIATRITESWKLGAFICKSLFYVEFIGGFCSIWTMVLISYDRFRLIVQRKQRIKPRTLLSIVLAWWTVSLIGALPMVFNFHVVKGVLETGESVEICSLDPSWSEENYQEIMYCCTVTMAGIVIPLGMIWHSHRKIRKVMTENMSRVASLSMGHPGSAVSQSHNIAKESRVLTMLKLLVFLFAVTWIPMVITILWIAIDTEMRLDSHFFLALWTMVAIGCGVNPIVYGVLNEHYKRRFKRFWYFMRGKQNNNCQENRESSII